MRNKLPISCVVWAAPLVWGAAGVLAGPQNQQACEERRGGCPPAPGKAELIPTRHFLLYSDTPESVSEALADELESTYAAVRAYLAQLGIHPGEPEGLLTVIQYDDPAVLAARAERQGLGRDVAGFFVPSSRTVYLTNLANRPEFAKVAEGLSGAADRLEELLRRRAAADPAEHAELDAQIGQLTRTIQAAVGQNQSIQAALRGTAVRHEVAHQVIHELGVLDHGAGRPAWLLEGLAAQVEHDLLIGTEPHPRPAVPWRLRDFRALIRRPGEEGLPAEEVASRAIAEKRFIELPTFLTRDELLRGAAHPGSSAEAYAQAWALVFYLATERPTEFAEYLCLVEGAESPELAADGTRRLADFAKAFGPVEAFDVPAWLVHMLDERLDPAGDGR